MSIGEAARDPHDGSRTADVPLAIASVAFG